VRFHNIKEKYAEFTRLVIRQNRWDAARTVSSEHRNCIWNWRNRTDCVSRRIIITIARLVVGEIVSLRTAEFRCKVLERATANSHEPANVSRIHRTWIMQHGNTYECECRYIRSSSFLSFGFAHFDTNIRMRFGKRHSSWMKENSRNKIPREILKLSIEQIVESNGRN